MATEASRVSLKQQDAGKGKAFQLLGSGIYRYVDRDKKSERSDGVGTHATGRMAVSPDPVLVGEEDKADEAGGIFHKRERNKRTDGSVLPYRVTFEIGVHTLVPVGAAFRLCVYVNKQMRMRVWV